MLKFTSTFSYNPGGSSSPVVPGAADSPVVAGPVDPPLVEWCIIVECIPGAEPPISGFNDAIRISCS